MSELIISVSGLRGIVGETLTPVVAARFVAAFALQLPPGDVIVGRDGRSSGPMLKDAIGAALRACGRNVIDADVAATPTIGVLVRDLGAAGAVQISASHNPPPYNGIKLFGGDGRVLDQTTGGKIRDAFLQDEAAWCPFDQIGHVSTPSDPHAPHLAAVLETVDVDAIRAAKHHVLIDSNHGAGSLLGTRLLSELGCQVVALGDCPDGQFSHTPEPTAENLAGVARQVAQSGCSIGFCQDPDADRLALIDANGRYIGEEYTLALCVQHALANPATRGPIVINGATSGMSERLAAAVGVPAHRSAVGEANVADRMIAEKATYGGEGNGGPIDPRVGYVRDSFVGMAQILDLMTATGQSLAELADALPRLAIHKDKAPLSTDALPALFRSLQERFSDAAVDHSDGLRLAWPDRWLLVRGSNTEPIVRLIAEAETDADARALCDQAKALIGS
ncbi:phosphoglucosamine mutase [Roseiconus nitratireducens]|uniref:Phosphoglucosamine mutase n=1 Tax=Roseiconus nitratireducens TaxID=2605748 RepID=A0A5M6D222_9BACT|nr:phosphoglucosamine mutase [Roseiconus nitratireducens]KAA5541557.1 phosphoglucosamine mutase [Roseiconus nitratireducens]